MPEAHDWGCLKCRVTWRGERQCWLCGSELFVVGSTVVREEVLRLPS